MKTRGAAIRTRVTFKRPATRIGTASELNAGGAWRIARPNLASKLLPLKQRNCVWVGVGGCGWVWVVRACMYTE